MRMMAVFLPPVMPDGNQTNQHKYKSSNDHFYHFLYPHFSVCSQTLKIGQTQKSKMNNQRKWQDGRGGLEYQKVEALMDMGVKPIYKLTTESGKSIRTTGNHPYLVRTFSEQALLMFIQERTMRMSWKS